MCCSIFTLSCCNTGNNNYCFSCCNTGNNNVVACCSTGDKNIFSSCATGNKNRFTCCATGSGNWFSCCSTSDSVSSSQQRPSTVKDKKITVIKSHNKVSNVQMNYNTVVKEETKTQDTLQERPPAMVPFKDGPVMPSPTSAPLQKELSPPSYAEATAKT